MPVPVHDARQALVLRVVAALDACDLPYTVAPSELNGAPIRSDAEGSLPEILAVLPAGAVDPLIGALGPEQAPSRAVLEAAVRTRGVVALTSPETGVRVGLRVAGRSPLDARQLERRRVAAAANGVETMVYVSTPEDDLLQRLWTFRSGSDDSEAAWARLIDESRWRTLSLDQEYLWQIGTLVGVSDLVERVFGS